MRNAFDQRIFLAVVRGDRQHTSGFVDNDQMVVFKDQRKRPIVPLFFLRFVALVRIELHAHQITRTDGVADFVADAAIDVDATFVEKPTNFAARQRRQTLDNQVTASAVFGLDFGGKYLDRHLSQACQGNGNGFSWPSMKNDSRSVVRTGTNLPPTNHFGPNNAAETLCFNARFHFSKGLTPVKIRPLTREEVRELDRIAIEQYGIAGIVLMENAGRNAADWITSHFSPGDVCILCGKGNNAGDGYVIARHIDTADIRCGGLADSSAIGNASWRVRIVSVVDCDELTGDAAINHEIAVRSGIPVATADDARLLQELVGAPDILVDCLLGTGATGAPRGLYAEAVRLANRLAAKRIAMDVPTGLDCDTAIAADPTFTATATLTFVAPKIGFSQASAAQFLGHVVPISIGVPRKLLERFQSAT